MYSMITFYSDDPSFNSDKVYIFLVQLLLKRTKIDKERPGLDVLNRLSKYFVLSKPSLKLEYNTEFAYFMLNSPLPK